MELESESLEQVLDFWEKNLCGSQFSSADAYTESFYKEYTALRYRKTHHLNDVIDWTSAKDKKLLEVGLGIGADSVRWAQNGAYYSGIDLTSLAVEATQKHFKICGLKGNIEKGNAENMVFDDASFDMVYSHGVLHHTENIRKALSEISRVLKPNGEFIVMLYAKGSFNYWIRIQLWFRSKLIAIILASKFGYRPKNKLWKDHLANFNEMGSEYLSWNTFPHRCTDGALCKISNTYFLSETKDLLNLHGFKVEKSVKAHFPLGAISPKLERLLGSIMGFHLLVWAKKVG